MFTHALKLSLIFGLFSAGFAFADEPAILVHEPYEMAANNVNFHESCRAELSFFQRCRVTATLTDIDGLTHEIDLYGKEVSAKKAAFILSRCVAVQMNAASLQKTLMIDLFAADSRYACGISGVTENAGVTMIDPDHFNLDYREVRPGYITPSSSANNGRFILASTMSLTLIDNIYKSCENARAQAKALHTKVVLDYDRAFNTPELCSVAPSEDKDSDPTPRAP